jgi:hypothetical protein
MAVTPDAPKARKRRHSAAECQAAAEAGVSVGELRRQREQVEADDAWDRFVARHLGTPTAPPQAPRWKFRRNPTRTGRT